MNPKPYPTTPERSDDELRAFHLGIDVQAFIERRQGLRDQARGLIEKEEWEDLDR